ncbi:hypothetical protein B0T25DRAFT_165976 [Lasiosphaeria hispida]|uniref:Uncharacterized protein n=1 Tax=Lasiosphaeria hispida TaxID=260671 RepID=A0AAJ0HN55_9PEZI|nr:hypothetical protein B0T25DRAFT_165976 [Lasiosphaeria hispida]
MNETPRLDQHRSLEFICVFLIPFLMGFRGSVPLLTFSLASWVDTLAALSLSLSLLQWVGKLLSTFGDMGTKAVGGRLGGLSRRICFTKKIANKVDCCPSWLETGALGNFIAQMADKDSITCLLLLDSGSKRLSVGNGGGGRECEGAMEMCVNLVCGGVGNSP